MKESCKDHKGIDFESKSEMCRYYNIPTSTFKNRMDRGWTLEQALTTPPDTTQRIIPVKICKDHKGQEFNSIKLMCEHYGIDEKVYWGRIRTGWSVENALTKPIVKQAVNSKTIKDHTGREFVSISDMCRAWNMPRNTYNLRIKNGWSVEKALTEPIHKINKTEPKECEDHLGNKFKSQNDLCRHYGITKDLLRSRLELGWSLEKILTNPEKINPKKKCTDHLGNEFDSFMEMAEAYNLTESALRGRLKQNYSLEEALTKTKNNAEKICFDHLGNCFDSIEEMCVYWNIPKFLYYARMESWSLSKTLTTIRPNTVIDEKLTVVKMLEEPYYIVTFEGESELWFDYEIFNYYRKINKIQIRR